MFYVFTSRIRQPTVSDGVIFFVLRFYRHSLFGTTSGGPIFRCTTKDRGERRAKGLRPLESPGVNGLGHSDVLCAYVFATVRVTRLSRLRRSAYPLASACCTALKDRHISKTTRMQSSHCFGQLRKSLPFNCIGRGDYQSPG